MALKLGKCRLCLKLGDFYSIFTVDNSLQLAEMVMECTRLKIYEGDGLPDKICSECIQKLSSAYIFKQQCERADKELRRNYVPPPGFGISSACSNREGSDSAFSSQPKPSSLDKPSPASRKRKKNQESIDSVSFSSQSQEHQQSTKKVDEFKKQSSKKAKRAESESRSIDSDYEDKSYSQFSPDVSDSDEPLLSDNTCKVCNKKFKNGTSLSNHMRTHKRQSLIEKTESPSPSFHNSSFQNSSFKDTSYQDGEEGIKMGCEKCGKTFKLQIMLKRHLEQCGKSPQVSPNKELLIALEPVDKVKEKCQEPIDTIKRIDCEMCSTKFKTLDNLKKHMKMVHAAVLHRDMVETSFPTGKVPVPCIFCQTKFDDYYVYVNHFACCPKRVTDITLECPVCHQMLSKTNGFMSHVKRMHFEPPFQSVGKNNKVDPVPCIFCQTKFDDYYLYVNHFATCPKRVKDITLECPVCHQMLSKTNGFMSHVKRMHFEPPFQSVGKNNKVDPVPCIFCQTKFDDYYLYVNHFATCPKRVKDITLECPVCHQMLTKINGFMIHVKRKHFEPRVQSVDKNNKVGSPQKVFECRVCNKKMNSEELLIKHLTAHVSNIEEINEQSRPNTPNDDSYSDYPPEPGALKCQHCEKHFKYKKSLDMHIKTHHNGTTYMQTGPPDDPSTSFLSYKEFDDSDSSPEDEDLSKHHMSSGTKKSATSLLKECSVRCLICDLEMKVPDINEHNQKHKSVNIKPRNLYTCIECDEKFINCKTLAKHIKLEHW